MSERLEALVREICGLGPDEPVTEEHRQYAIHECRGVVQMYAETITEINRQMAELRQRRAESLRVLEAGQAEHEALTGRRYEPHSK